MYRKKYLVLLCSGIAFAVPFLFPQLFIVSFFSAIPLFYVFFRDLIQADSEAVRLRNFIKYTIVFAMPFYLAVYIWFLWFYPLDFAGLSSLESAVVAGSAWIGFPILQTLVLLIIPVGFFLLRKICFAKPFILPLLAASLYVIAEWVQSWFLTGLTWAKLSISQYQNLPAIQSVSVFGTYFTSFLIIFINSGAALYIYNKYTVPLSMRADLQNSKIFVKKNNLLIMLTVLSYFLNSYFGFFRIMFYQYPADTVTVQIVQGNISSHEKWEEGTGISYSLEKYMKLTADGIEIYGSKPDISLWSETAIPGSAYYKSDIYNILSDVAAKNDIALITGVFFDDYENDKEYNSMMAFLPPPNDDVFLTPYNKRHLVPFGEYLPLEDILTSVFPFVANMSMFESTINWGESENLIEIDDVKYGGLICFDSIFPELARSSVKAGANILTVVSNDSWYRDSIGIYQHNAQSVLRAVENNRYVIRSANTGISSFISPIGEILEQTEVDKDAVITREVGIIKDNMTVYTVCGDITLYFSVVFIIMCAVLKQFKQLPFFRHSPL